MLEDAQVLRRGLRGNVADAYRVGQLVARAKEGSFAFCYPLSRQRDFGLVYRAGKSNTPGAVGIPEGTEQGSHNGLVPLSLPRELGFANGSQERTRQFSNESSVPNGFHRIRMQPRACG